MLENNRLGDICIIEKCYVLTGIEANSHSLFFLALKKLMDFERNASIENINVAQRHTLLKEFQTKLNLSPAQSKIKYPKSELKHVTEKILFFEPTLSLETSPKLSIPLPLPQVTGEFAIATLMLRFKLPNLLKITMLLLLEQSVLVIGASADEVSSCTCALLDLLKPYKWAS